MVRQNPRKTTGFRFQKVNCQTGNGRQGEVWQNINRGECKGKRRRGKEKRATGYKLEREAVPGGAGGSPAGMLFNKAEPGKTQAGRLRPQEETRLAAAMQRDLRPVGKVIAEALQNRDWGAAKKRLAGILGKCGTESAGVIEEAMRQDGGEENHAEAQRDGDAEGAEAVANTQARGKTVPGTNEGSFAPGDGGGEPEKAPAKKEYKPAAKEAVEKFQKELPKEITPEEFDSLLTAGFTDADGAGNTVKYGTLLRDHIVADGRDEQDRDARKNASGRPWQW